MNHAKRLRAMFRRFRRPTRIVTSSFFLLAVIAVGSYYSFLRVDLSRAPIALAAEGVGAGLGVPACASATPSTGCNADGTAWATIQYVAKTPITITGDFSAGAFDYSPVYCSTVSQSASAGAASLASSGSQTFNGLQANRTYNYTINELGNSLTCDGGSDSSPTTYSYTPLHPTSYTVTTPNCVVTPSAPSGTIWGNGCTLSGGTCTGHLSWSAANTTNNQVWVNLVPPGGAEYNWSQYYTGGSPAVSNTGNTDVAGFNQAGTWTAKLYDSNATTFLNSTTFQVFDSGVPQATPATPTPLTATCDASGTQVTLSWPAVSNATTYAPGLFLPLGSTCPSGWTQADSGGYTTCQTSTAGTSVTGTIPSNVSITGVIYAGNPNATPPYSSGTTKTFTCSPAVWTTYCTGAGNTNPANDWQWWQYDNSTPKNYRYLRPGDGLCVQPTAALSANPTTVLTGKSATLKWSSSASATSCTAAGGFSTGGATSGSVSVGPLTSDSTYSVTCSNANGSSAPAQATVTVVNPTVSITASPTRVISGGPTVVNWSATAVTNCSITKNGTAWKSGLVADGSGKVTGSDTDTITGQTVYKMTCTDLSASTQAASVVVNVGSQGYQEF